MAFNRFIFILRYEWICGTNANQRQQFGEVLSLPDLWQRKALNLLREGQDVVLHAPTGAGKTFVFEQLIESGWKGKAVYTVQAWPMTNFGTGVIAVGMSAW